MKNLATLFIDESGKSSLAEKANEPFLLTGIVADDSERQIIEGFFGYIKLKYGIDQKNPFHSYDVFENPKTKLNDSELISLSSNLADFISLIPIETYIYSVNKGKFKKALGIKSDGDFKGSSNKKALREFPYRIMATKLFVKFGKYLDKHDQIGQIIADSRRGADYQLIKTLSTVKEGGINILDKDKVSIKNRLNAIMFVEKGYLSGGVEITDLISYTSFARSRRLLSTLSHTGLDKIWKQIRCKTKIIELKEAEIRKFFGIKKGEVHKYLG